jgi:hypothetical protein
MSRSAHIMRARQLAKRAEREAVRNSTPATPTRSSDEDWLASNYAPEPVPEPEHIDPFTASIIAFQREIDRLDNDNHQPDCKGVTPGLVRISNAKEPKSIHSPVPPSRLQFERPAKRKIGDRNDRFCEIPDQRKKRTMTLVDGDGVARGVIGINPFAKRVAFAGFGLRQRAPVPKAKP